MNPNENKCYFFVAGHRYETFWSKVGETRIWESKNGKLLGLAIDKKPKF